jgi:hypothetical protein
MAMPITPIRFSEIIATLPALIADRADSLKLETATRLGWLDQNRTGQLLGLEQGEVRTGNER